MGALALADIEPQAAGEALHSALESVQLAMAEFSPDGAWKEGPGYWNYATSYNVVLLAGLQTALGTDFGLSGVGAFRETGLFPIYLSGPLGRTFNYADGSDHTLYPAQMFWLARALKQPVFAWYAGRASTPSALDLLWFDAADVGPKAAGLPLDKCFRGAEVVILRSDWDDPRALFILHNPQAMTGPQAQSRDRGGQPEGLPEGTEVAEGFLGAATSGHRRSRSPAPRQGCQTSSLPSLLDIGVAPEN